jgi:signal transduction histidine kinase
MKLHPRLADATVAVAVAIAMALTITVAEEPGATRSPDVLAYAMGTAVGALQLARRRWPLGVLIGSIGLLWVYYGLGYSAFSPAVPLAAAAYAAVAAGHLIATSLLLCGVLLFSLGWQVLFDGSDLLVVFTNDTIADGALLAAIVLLAEAVRNRRAWAAEVRLRAERDAARRVQEERLRIARDVHDVLAHTVSAINVQAGVVADVVGDEAPPEARAALGTIREESRRAMAELRATVGLLRERPRGLGELERLVETTAGAGVRVDVEVSGDPRPVPPAVDRTAYRIVQESLTNVVRHARATAAKVALRYDDAALVLSVEDDGRGANGGGDDGHGLAGMRERAAAVGGTVEAGPAPGRGFRVVARLPA